MFVMRSLAAALLVVSLSVPADAFETRATSAYVVDQKTGTVLLQKNATVPLPPASMSKLMTLYVTFEAIRDGRLDLEERLPVSEHAMSYRGSTMFLDTTDRVSVEDLIRGIIVLSGNDACAVLAEALSPDGTEAGFARFTTERARQMGMNDSVFLNSNGWPQDGHEMSMRDLAILANRLIVDFPEFYPMFAETEFAFDGRAPSNTRNRNPLLSQGIGADGLKTGHTQEAGYGLVGSAKQGDRRVIFVISGLETQRARSEEAAALVNWSFRHFAEKTIARSGEPIAQADIWMGRERSVDLVAAEDMSILIPTLAANPVSAEVVYRGPVNAPVQAGQELAELVITLDELPEIRLPLVAAQAVPRGGFFVKVRTAAEHLLARFTDTTDTPGAPS